MKRSWVVLTTALATVVLTSSQVLAQQAPAASPAPLEPAVDAGGIAVTGASISLGMVVVGLFLLVGFTVLVLSRGREGG